MSEDIKLKLSNILKRMKNRRNTISYGIKINEKHLEDLKLLHEVGLINSYSELFQAILDEYFYKMKEKLDIKFIRDNIPKANRKLGFYKKSKK